ncbi:hypothetical protein NNG48_07315 [Enterococcus faecium]|nr:hypothetical protein [Enterococcus faecium]
MKELKTMYKLEIDYLENGKTFARMAEEYKTIEEAVNALGKVRLVMELNDDIFMAHKIEEVLR